MQATYSVKKLGIDEERVNPNGGAIALGHPLGCTGARQTATLLYELARRGEGARFGVVSMCIGSGEGWCGQGAGRRARACACIPPSLPAPPPTRPPALLAGMGAAAVFEQGSEADAYPARAVGTQSTGLSRDARV